MNIILCVDDNGGLLFNHRRQSRDRNVIQKIITICDGSPLWINNFSAKLFGEISDINLKIDEDFLEKAKSGEYAFVENCSIQTHEEQIEKIFLIKWNRVYPRDFSMDLPLIDHGWIIKSAEEFPGYSHEKITLEVYTK